MYSCSRTHLKEENKLQLQKIQMISARRHQRDSEVISMSELMEKDAQSAALVMDTSKLEKCSKRQPHLDRLELIINYVDSSLMHFLIILRC